MIHYFCTPAPGSTLNRKMFNQMIAMIKQPYDAVYINPINFYMLKNLNFESDLIIFAVDDHAFFTNYNHWTKQPEHPLISYFKTIAEQNPHKTFILILVDDCFTNEYFAPLTNIHIIRWFECNENDSYINIVPVEKNIESQKIGICLNRRTKPHRYSLISYLMSKNYENFCHISAMHLYQQFHKLPSDNIMDHLDWQFDARHESIKQDLCVGFKKLYKIYTSGVDFQKPLIDIYELDKDESTVLLYDNKKNFDQNLRQLYANSLVEFVSCTLFSEPAVEMNEKYLNTVYGKNFPVLISSPHSVEFLRNLGFDMFDDIVNHSYDKIVNPIDRLITSVESNVDLIKNPSRTKKLWLENQHRFQANIEFAKKDMYEILERKSLQNWQTAILMFANYKNLCYNQSK